MQGRKLWTSRLIYVPKGNQTIKRVRIDHNGDLIGLIDDKVCRVRQSKVEELWSLKNDIPEDTEEKTIDNDPTKKTSYFNEFEMSKDRKSLMIVQNRVIIILDINKKPTSMIWAFDLKPYKSGIV
jgi:hypothetical protein